MFLSIEVNDNEPSLSAVGVWGARGAILPENKREHKYKETIHSCCSPLQIFKLPPPLSLMMITQNISISHDPVS